MSAENESTGTVQALLDRLASGDVKAADDLIEYATERLRRLTHRMLQDNQRVHRWEETGDVLQNSLMRLHRALKAVKPTSERHFINLAATQIRRELIDLARHHFGPQGERSLFGTAPRGPQESGKQVPIIDAQADPAPGPRTIYRKNEEFKHETMRVHELVESLPEDEREVFSLIFYLELEQADVAKRLGISIPTVRRRYRSARLILGRKIEADASET